MKHIYYVSCGQTNQAAGTMGFWAGELTSPDPLTLTRQEDFFELAQSLERVKLEFKGAKVTVFSCVFLRTE